jgi:hypothetical protein
MNNLAHTNNQTFSLPKEACLQPLTIQTKAIGPIDDCVYVSGYVKGEFGNPGLQKEFERCLLSGGEKNEIDQYSPKDHDQASKNLKKKLKGKLPQYLYLVLSKPENAYLAREMTWSLVNSYGNAIYTLQSSQFQLQQLIEAIKPREQDETSSVSESERYKMSPPVMVVGKVEKNPMDDLPNLLISKIDTINPSLIMDNVSKELRDINIDKLKRIMVDILSMAENDGDTDKDRALNYSLQNNHAIYRRSYKIIYDSSNGNSPAANLTSVQVLPEISGDRLVAKVVFDYHNNNGSGNESWYSVVDINGEYPFILVPFKPYIPRY